MRSQTQRSTEAGKKKKKGQGPRLSAFPEPGKGQGSGSGTRRGLLGSPELYLVPEGHSRAESPERNPPTRAAPDAPREASFGGSWAGPWPLHAGAPNRAARGAGGGETCFGREGGRCRLTRGLHGRPSPQATLRGGACRPHTLWASRQPRGPLLNLVRVRGLHVRGPHPSTRPPGLTALPLSVRAGGSPGLSSEL